MSRVKVFVLMLLGIAVVAACRKEHDRPQWDVDVLGPLAKGTLGIDNLVADSLIHVNPDSSVTLIYNKILYSLIIDSLVRIPDTTVATPFFLPIPLTLAPNTRFSPAAGETRLSVNNVQLSYTIVKSGKAHILATNKLHTKVFFVYSIPKATLNGVPFSVSAFVDSADSHGIKILTKDIDLSGYDLDLTGISGNKVNTIEYSVTATTDPNGPSVNAAPADTFLLISNSFIGMVPFFAKGGLGQTTFNVNDGSVTLDLFKNVKSGLLNLAAATMKFTIENDLGMDAQLRVNAIESVNSNTGNTVTLNAASIIDQTLNINRAGLTGTNAFPSYIPTFYSLQIDNSNSNLTAFLNNLPGRLLYKLVLETNPLGNASGNNDFAFSDHLANINMNVEVPLSFSADHLTLTDTADFTLAKDSIFNNLGAGTLTFNVDNGFPFALNISATAIDGNNQLLDVLLTSAPVAGATLDANLKVISKVHSQFVITVDEAKMERLRMSKRIIVMAAFTTNAPGSQHVSIYSDYSFDFKIIADINYHVR